MTRTESLSIATIGFHNSGPTYTYPITGTVTTISITGVVTQ